MKVPVTCTLTIEFHCSTVIPHATVAITTVLTHVETKWTHCCLVQISSRAKFTFVIPLTPDREHLNFDIVALCYNLHLIPPLFPPSLPPSLPLSSPGYVYLTFDSERSVKALLMSCTHDPMDAAQYYFRVSSRRMRDKEVQVISWALSDSNSIRCPSPRLDPSRTVFVGGLHGLINAGE